MPKKPVQPQDKYVLRLPDGMRERIKSAAEANNRSMNAEIVARLEQSLAGIVENVGAQSSRLAYRLEAIERTLDRMSKSIAADIAQHRAVMADPERLTPARRAFRQGITAFARSETKDFVNLIPPSDPLHRDFLQGFYAAARRYYRNDDHPQVVALRERLMEERAARRWSKTKDDE